MPRAALILGFLFLLTSCGTDAGPEAPAVAALETACIELGCIDYPGDWTVEIGSDFISLTHPAAPGMSFATVGSVDMEGITAATGGTWPAATSSVVGDFWALVGGGEDAELLDVEPARPDGSVRSEGKLGGLHMWHRLAPTGGAAAIGVEVRAPNDSWQAHADVIIDSLVPGTG